MLACLQHSHRSGEPECSQLALLPGAQARQVGGELLQLGLLALVDFADLTWGMLVLQAWTFDPDWLPSRRRFEGGAGSEVTAAAPPVTRRRGCLPNR